MQLKDYYNILGIPSTATPEDIKVAYRKLSKKFHPDINDGDTFFEEKFKEILEAYNVLSNTDKRANYDYKRNIKINNTATSSAAEPLKKREPEFPKPEQSVKPTSKPVTGKEKVADPKVLSKRLNKIAIYAMIVIGVCGTAIFLFFNFKDQEPLPVTHLPVDSIDTVINNADSIINLYPEIIKEDTSKNKVSKGDSLRILGLEKAYNKAVVLLTGTWTGNAYHYSTNQSWPIRLNCNFKKGEYKINYLVLGCSGYWQVENITENIYEFTQHIDESNGTCNDGGHIKLEVTNDREMEVYIYGPDFTTLLAKGKLNKT